MSELLRGPASRGRRPAGLSIDPATAAATEGSGCPPARQPAAPLTSIYRHPARPALRCSPVHCSSVALHCSAHAGLVTLSAAALSSRGLARRSGPALQVLAGPGRVLQGSPGPARHCRSSLGPAGFCRARLARPGTIAGLAGPAGTNAGPRLAVSYCSGEGVSLLSTNTATLITGLQFWRPRHCSPAVQHSSLCRICCSHRNHTRRG